MPIILLTKLFEQSQHFKILFLYRRLYVPPIFRSGKTFCLYFTLFYYQKVVVGFPLSHSSVFDRCLRAFYRGTRCSISLTLVSTDSLYQSMACNGLNTLELDNSNIQPVLRTRWIFVQSCMDIFNPVWIFPKILRQWGIALKYPTRYGFYDLFNFIMPNHHVSARSIHVEK